MVLQQTAIPAATNGQRGHPAGHLQRALELAAIRDKLAAANCGQEPTAAQVAEVAGVPVRTARRLLGMAQQVV